MAFLWGSLGSSDTWTPFRLKDAVVGQYGRMTGFYDSRVIGYYGMDDEFMGRKGTKYHGIIAINSDFNDREIVVSLYRGYNYMVNCGGFNIAHPPHF